MGKDVRRHERRTLRCQERFAIRNSPIWRPNVEDVAIVVLLLLIMMNIMIKVNARVAPRKNAHERLHGATGLQSRRQGLVNAVEIFISVFRTCDTPA